MFNKLKEKHFKKGYDSGYEDGYSKGIAFATEYYEATMYDNKIKQEIDKVESKTQSSLENFRVLEDFLSWVKYVHEIADSDYFRYFVFSGNTPEEVQSIITYLDYLGKSIEIKTQYPYIHDLIPEVFLSVSEIYENKLLVQETEEVLKTKTL